MWFGDAKTVKIRKPRPCDFCGEMLEKGQPAVTWTYADQGLQSVSLHPECHAVLQERGRDDDEFSCGDSPRGCDCGYSKGCSCGWEEREEAKSKEQK